MYEHEKRELIEAGKKLDRYQLIALSGGNLSYRTENNEVLMTPSGMIYEELVEDDIVVMDLDGKVIEGNRRPSVDNEAIRYIFKNREDIHAIIHTHQPYATAIGLVEDLIPCNLTTLANATRGAVRVAPYSSAASIDMGIQAVEHLGEQLAVVLKHHGVIAVGDSISQALYAAVYLEEAAKTLVLAKSYGGSELPQLSDEQIQTAVDIFNNYGQK